MRDPEARARAIVAAAVARLGGEGRVVFEPHVFFGYQREIADDPHRMVVTEASTKVGKTFLHIELLLQRAIAAGEGNWWWVATVSATARIAFERMKDRLDGFIQQPTSAGFAKVRVGKPIGYRARSTPDMEIEVAGARIQFRSAKDPDTLYGEDVRGAVGDEYSRWSKAAYTALYSTLVATGGWLRLIGNVTGRGWGWSLARAAEGGAEGWGYHRVTAWDGVEAGLLSREVVEQAERDMSPVDFALLFLAEAPADGLGPFGDISAAYMDGLAVGAVSVWGWDFGRKRDWTCAVGLTVGGEVAGFDRYQKPWDEVIEDVVARPGDAYLDETGLGDVVVDLVKARKGNGVVHGVVFTSARKQVMYQALGVALRSGMVRIPRVGAIAEEIASLEYQYTPSGVKYGAPEGLHDDAVAALALAVSGCVFGSRGVSEGAVSGGDDDMMGEEWWRGDAGGDVWA